MIIPFYKSLDRKFTILQGDCRFFLQQFSFKFDMIFADPPYFLSNGGISCKNNKIVCVDKGDWDKCKDKEQIDAFNREWIGLCSEKLKDGGTIWVCGTFHNIFSVEKALTAWGFKILNIVTWAKTNPPPNISCKYFTHSTEFLIWARKGSRHFYNYEMMKYLNDGKQMPDMWQMPAVASWEKKCGKHPTQKPLPLLIRVIMASTVPNAWILDPFAGSSTTGIAANLIGRRYLGIEKEVEYAELSKKRKMEIEDEKTNYNYRLKIIDIKRGIPYDKILMASNENIEFPV